MTIRATLVCLVVLFSCAAAAESYAQGTASADEAAKPELHARLQNLAPDKHIRVQHTTRGVLDGKFLTVNDASMVMVVETPDAYETHTMALSDVDTVWKRNGYTAWGGLMGALVGGMVGAALAPDDDYFLADVDRAAYVTLGVLLGGITGLVVGHQIHSYSMIYPETP